jgi:hypothetical protein
MTQPADELEAKIKFLAKVLNTTEKDLLDKHRSTVRSGYRTNRINGDIECELATKCGFDPGWPEWRTGTKLQFEKRGTARQADATTGPRLRAIRTAEPEACYEPIASLQLFASQPGRGEPWPLSADLVCQPARMEGVVIAVRRGWLTFHCGEGETERLEKRKGFPDGLAIGNATCLPAGAYTKRPSWEIYSISGPLGIVALPYDFCPISGLTPGCAITVTFSVYIKDLEDEEMTDGEEGEFGGTVQTGSDSFIRPGFTALGSAKQKILKRLALKQLSSLGNQESQEEKEGRKVICLDRLLFQAEKGAEAE